MTLMKKSGLLLFELILVFNLNSPAYAQKGGCRIVPRNDVPSEKQPLYLSGGELAKVERRRDGSGILVRRGGTLSFACPGKGNALMGGDQSEEGVCVGGNVFRIRNRQVTVMEILCRDRVKAELNQTRLACARNGARTIEVGFSVSGTWYKVFDICYDYKAGETLYAHHTVESLLLDIDEKNGNRPNFVVGIKGLYPYQNPKSAFENQRDYLERTFPNTRYWVQGKYSLDKGHLAPDGDFMLTNWQWATYFFANVAPQWSTINRGNWVAVENKVRHLANSWGSDLEVWTGASGVLELPDGDEVKEARLGRFPIPLYFWKLALDPGTGAGIVFVSENDPFQALERPPPCRDICRSAGYYFSETADRGRIYCCQLTDQLRDVLPGLPDVDATDVLGSD